MIAAKLKITEVNTTHVDEPSSTPCFVCIPKIELHSSPRVLTVRGTGFAKDINDKQDVLCCTLVRSGKNKKEPWETIEMVARFSHKCDNDTSSNWHVKFNVEYPATYLFTCHAFKHGDAQVLIKIHKLTESGVTPKLAFDPGYPEFTPSAITVKGTVINAGNLPSCSLAPSDCGGGTTGKAAQGIVTWLDSPQDMHWYCQFNGSFTRCYQVDAEASGEGSISSSGEV
jgi:hypothetical protein